MIIRYYAEQNKELNDVSLKGRDFLTLKELMLIFILKFIVTIFDTIIVYNKNVIKSMLNIRRNENGKICCIRKVIQEETKRA